MKLKTLIPTVILAAGLMTGCGTGASGTATVGDVSIISQADIKVANVRLMAYAAK